MKAIKYQDRFIHEYQFGDKDINYCIGLNEDESYIDEDEAGNFGLDEYQEALKKFGAKQFEHEFDYSDGYTRIVQDSYFNTVEQCKNAIDYLIQLENKYNDDLKNGLVDEDYVLSL